MYLWTILRGVLWDEPPEATMPIAELEHEAFDCRTGGISTSTSSEERRCIKGFVRNRDNIPLI